MQLSYKIRRLLIVSLAIIILALAADNGWQANEKILSNTVTAKNRESITLDSRALDFTPQSKPTPEATPKPTPPPIARPDITAEAYLVAHLGTGEVYSEFNPTTVFPIASISKLITALVALETMQPDRKITITEQMLEGYGTAGDLQLDDTLTLSELITPLLLESSNDAAEAIAHAYGYQPFIEKMNEFVKRIGMNSTSFKDASGISPGNISNARDLLRLSRYLYAQEKPILEITRKATASLASTTEHSQYFWETNNPFPNDPHFIGGKTGRTIEAKESMISLFSYLHSSTTYPLAVIVLRSEFSSRELDTSVLLTRFIKKVQAR